MLKAIAIWPSTGVSAEKLLVSDLGDGWVEG